MTDVVNRWFAVGEVERLPFADGTFDLVIGSPPYLDARTYDDPTLPASRKGPSRGKSTLSMNVYQWVPWMLAVVAECTRVCNGPVVMVACGAVRDRNYQPACEGLAWEWFRKGAQCHLDRPTYWRRVGIMGSGGDQSFRSDVETCMVFKRPGPLPYADNTACGKRPRHAAGGNPSHRAPNGCRKSDGSRDSANRYVPPDLSNPGNFIATPDHPGNVATLWNDYIDTGAGGKAGHMTKHANQNEAPFRPEVPERFVKSYCPPGGLVLDPFSGSGTTVEVCERLGRRGVGLDLRRSQCRDIALARLVRPHAPVSRRADVATESGRTLFDFPEDLL